MNETTGKLEVLTILNQEFFNEIREKKDEQTLINHFGSAHGRLLWRHTILERIYDEARGENDMAMAGEEDGEQAISEELRIAQENLTSSTQKMIRQFSKMENRAKLQAFRNEMKLQESELSEFNQTWNELGELITYWLTTPQEEVKSNTE